MQSVSNQKIESIFQYYKFIDKKKSGSMSKSKLFFSLIVLFISALAFSCSKNPPDTTGSIIPPVTPPILPPKNEVTYWLTRPDKSVLLQKQTTVIPFTKTSNTYQSINIDTTQIFQEVDGFGYTLTGGSAYVINQLNPSVKENLLKELFGKEENSVSISYLRLSMGASDLDAAVFSYNDLPEGETDPNLDKFSFSKDKVDLIPLLKQILAINPDIKILATPWSPPVWMKDNQKTIGGNLLPEYYETYAKYFVKYVQHMKIEGIAIDAITPQNEPLHPGNNPSMYMAATDQAYFIKNNLGPAFKAAGIATKIIIYDHNCDKPEYPISILNDAAANEFIDGSAFHLYAGDISALSKVHNAHPDKNVYFTEQWTSSQGNFGGDLKWHLKNVIIGSMRNWSKVALEWNLANDPAFGPHTPGGCTECLGALTIGSSVTRNVGYYIIAHASKFVPPGSVRIGSNTSGDLGNVAFKTPSGKKALIVLNEGQYDATFNLKLADKWAVLTLPGGAVGTYIWN